MSDAVKDKAFFGILFTASVVLGLAMEALSLIRMWLNYFPMSLSGMIFVGFLLAKGIIFVGLLLAFLIRSGFLGGDKWESWFDALVGFMLGLSLVVFVSLLLGVANWGLQEGVKPKLLSVMLAFSLASTIAYFMAAMIVSSQEEIRVDDKRDEVKVPLLWQ
jgi:hypothetical protein